MRARVFTAAALLPPALAIIFLARPEPLLALLTVALLLSARELKEIAGSRAPFIPVIGLVVLLLVALRVTGVLEGSPPRTAYQLFFLWILGIIGATALVRGGKTWTHLDWA
jgi:CDP-diglyceride synthetase